MNGISKTFLATVLVLAGCATPIGVNRVGMDRAYQQITASALTGPELSAETLVVLGRYGLEKLVEQAPDLTVARLQEKACNDKRPELLFALADLSYATAERYEKYTLVTVHQQDQQTTITVPGKRAARAYYFASAVYSYFYLFGEGAETPGLYDRQFRTVCDFYNRGLAKALKQENSDQVNLISRDLRLPMGKVSVVTTRPGSPWTEAQFHEFVAADEYVVRGLQPRERVPGLGVPLIGSPDWTAFPTNWSTYYTPYLKVPATAFLRVEGSVCDMTSTRLKATLELYSGRGAPEIKVGERTVPLETDYTAVLAYGLQHSIQWKTRMAQFFSGNELIKARVYLTQPYVPGKIPLVFVYGTSGSPSDWAAAFNMLQRDPQVAARYQFWYFVYNTGNPIAYSGWRLRDSLDKVVTGLDPQGKDPALRNVVVIGHSQGGLVTKLAAVDSGNKFWGLISDKPIEELKLSPESRELLRNCLFFEHSPYVHRVILACAPNKGSILVNNWIQRLSQSLISMPAQLTRLGADLATLNVGSHGNPAIKQLGGKVPTSVANMNPNNPFLGVLHDLPLADDIKGHTIIGVLGDGPFEKANDGVVAYSSAHLPDMESEDIVHGDHGEVLTSPVTVEYLRRILLLHSKDAQLASVP